MEENKRKTMKTASPKKNDNSPLPKKRSSTHKNKKKKVKKNKVKKNKVKKKKKKKKRATKKKLLLATCNLIDSIAESSFRAPQKAFALRALIWAPRLARLPSELHWGRKEAQ